MLAQHLSRGRETSGGDHVATAPSLHAPRGDSHVEHHQAPTRAIALPIEQTLQLLDHPCFADIFDGEVAQQFRRRSKSSRKQKRGVAEADPMEVTREVALNRLKFQERVGGLNERTAHALTPLYFKVPLLEKQAKGRMSRLRLQTSEGMDVEQTLLDRVLETAQMSKRELKKTQAYATWDFYPLGDADTWRTAG
jgi:hypothetical protein